jgi:hypothetical protein
MRSEDCQTDDLFSYTSLEQLISGIIRFARSPLW